MIKSSMLKLGAGLILACVVPNTLAQNLRVAVTDTSGELVADAVVEVMLPPEIAMRFAAPSDAVIDQVDKEFVPSITTIVAGSKIRFPNSDDILHHVYSFSPINTFDIPLYGSDGTARFIEEFPQAGIVEIGCNIHDWMLAYIYVSETSKVGVSNAAGEALISEIPAGEYSVRIWHSRLPRNTEFVMATAEIQGTGTAELSVTLELERERRIRRAPSADRKRYR